MENNYYQQEYSRIDDQSMVESASRLLKNVYLWMTFALAITGLTAYYVASTPQVLNFIFGTRGVFTILVIAELGLVIGLSAAINSISALTATLMFMLYSVVNGLTLGSIFLVYSIESIASTFFITAGTFGAMALYGAVTRSDLTKFGNIALMALVGLIIATVVNLFLKNTMFDLIISGIGILLFTGLTAYDSQKIKAMLYGQEESDLTNRIAVLGALTLYLDFVNLFLYILRFFGRRD